MANYNDAMLATEARPARFAAFVLLGIVAIALAVRLIGLDDRTLTHPELFVPGIALPDYATTPAMRHSIRDVVIESLRRDIHPPGFYVGMWLWTMLFGTSVFAMRLPAALIGTATVWLLVRFARSREGKEVGGGLAIAWTAAALLALHGHHVLWSQQARMWVFLPFIALLTVELRDSVAARVRTPTAIAYLLVCATGLWFEYSFWIFFAVHMLYELVRSAAADRLPATVQLQFLAVAVGSPALAYLWIDIERGAGSFLEGAGVVHQLTGFLALQWVVGGSLAPESFSPFISQAILALMVISSALLVAGIFRARGLRTFADPADYAPIPWLAALACALAPTSFAIVFLAGVDEPAALAIAACAPWLVVGIGFGLVRLWPTLSPLWARFIATTRAQRWAADPTTIHALGPIAAAALLSLAIPSVAARSLMITLPFGVLLVARGISAIPARAVAGVVTALLLIACAMSIRHYSRPETLGVDYRALAEKMAPLADDTILIQNDWWALPMHYYLPEDAFRTGDYGPRGRELLSGREGPPARVWLIAFEDRDAKDVAAASARLRDHRITRREEVPGAVAFLLERRPTRSAPRS